MSLQYYFNGVEIDADDVLNSPSTEEQITVGDQKLLASTMDIELNNTDRSYYDDRYPGSLFYGVDWYNADVRVYDDELGYDIWKGRIKNLEVSEKDNKLLVKTANIVADLSKTTCVCTYAGIAPSEAIYRILTEVAGITDEYLLLPGFSDAIAYQQANGVLVDLNISVSKNATCISVINELCRMCQVHIYGNYQLEMWQWKPWAGQNGQRITGDNYVLGSYKHSFSDTNILNHYSITCKNSTTVATVTGELAASINKYGKRSLVIPAEKNSSTTPADYPIIFSTAAAGTFAGNLALQRWGYLKKLMEIEIDEFMEPVRLNTQIDLDFEPFVREPVRVTYRNHDKKNKVVAIRGEHMNTPQVYFSRDTTRPDPVELVRVVQSGLDEALVVWTEIVQDILTYRLYFATQPRYWETEFARQGVSPIQNNNPGMTVDGYRYMRISGLQSLAKYLFNVRTLSDILIESVESNIIELTLTGTGWEFENKYRVQGNAFAGLTLDITNSGKGYLPTGYTHYDELNYDAGTYEVGAVFESRLFQSARGFTGITVHVNSPDGRITLAWRDYNNGSFGAWQEIGAVTGYLTIDLAGVTAFQLRAVWDGVLYSDPDKLTIIGTTEAS